jgi:hypothetical protein
MKFLFLSFFCAITAIASEQDLAHRPPSFSFQDSKAVFTDFNHAHYEITYDLNTRSAFAKAVIQFDLPESGYPVFDSVTAPQSLTLDGTSVSALETKTPSNETTVRVIQQKAGIGRHRLEVMLPITELVRFSSDGVRSAFWTSDLDERNFLERYLPSNFEYDQVKMDFLIRFVGLKNSQSVYTNGQVTQVDTGTYAIDYPSHYTASSIFFHTVPEGSMLKRSFTITSIDGRTLPVTLYTSPSSQGSSLEALEAKVKKVISELESDYGPFPHPSVLIYKAGSGGMEYCGATMTDSGSVEHELFHSYFARGVMPANGNSGWLDEALASWRDNGYPSLTALSGTSGMSSHPRYTRITDQAAYSFGARFMAYLDGKTRKAGGLKPFLRFMVANRTFKPLFVEEFISEMGRFYQTPFASEFKKYTYGGAAIPLVENGAPHHKGHKMSLKQLEEVL